MAFEKEDYRFMEPDIYDSDEEICDDMHHEYVMGEGVKEVEEDTEELQEEKDIVSNELLLDLDDQISKYLVTHGIHLFEYRDMVNLREFIERFI
jgi:hypothetical protein